MSNKYISYMSRTGKMLLLAFLTLTLTGSCIKKNTEVLNTPYTKLEFTSAVESQKFELFSNFLWTIEITDPWITVTPAKGYGDKELSVSVSANTDLNARTSTFFIVGEKTRKEISITQAGEAPVLQLNEKQKSIDANGGKVSVVLTTNVEVAVTSDVDWIQLSQTRTVQSATYSFTVSPNTTLSERVGKVQFKQTDGSLSDLLTVTQTGEVPEVKVSVDSLAVAYEGGDVFFDVLSNIKWSVTEEADWLTAASTKLMETKTVQYTAAANQRVEPRKAELTVKATDYPDMAPARIVVSQLGAPAAMTLSKDTLDSLPAAGAVGKILVEANFVWEVDKSQTAAWVTKVTPATDAVEITVAKNEDITPRSTKVILAQKGGSYTKTIVINQLEGKSAITLPVEISVMKAEGGYLAIPVLTNTTWTAEVTRDWVRVVSTKGMELETLTLEFDANPDSKERMALLVVTTQEDSIVSRILTQAAAAAALTLEKDTVDVSSAAGSHRVEVSSNIKWAVDSRPDWIPSVSVRDGADAFHKTFGFTVDANTAIEPRSGKIVLRQTDAARGITPLTATLVVNQAAAKAYVNASVSYTQPLDNEGDSFQLSVASNIEVTYRIENSPSWIGMTGSSTEGDTATYGFSVQPVTDAASRRVQLQVVGTQQDTVYKTFTVVQRGARIARSDSLALVRFYNNTTGASWKDTYLWNLQLPATTWKGVTLEEAVRAGAFHVKRLELPNARLLGIIGDAHILGQVIEEDPLTSLTYLEVINLSGNSGLGGSLPASWSQLAFLETLDLSDCNLVNDALAGGTNIPKQYGAALRSLTVFKLKGNLLSGTLPAEVVAHPNFVQWNFDDNIKTQKQGELTLP